MRLYHVYIMASRSGVLYIGVTGNLGQRLFDHRNGTDPTAFTSRYHVTRLVHLEEFTHVHQAIAREKVLKGWRREKKLALVAASNPTWEDLSASHIPALVR